MNTERTAHNTTALILAAGRGTRLLPLTESTPKCLTRLGERSFLAYTIDILLEAGINEIVIISGYCADALRAFVCTNYAGTGVRLVRNPAYDETGTTASFLLGLKAKNRERDVLIIEGDVLFDADLLLTVLAADGNATAVASYSPELSGSFITMNNDGMIDNWLHEQARPPGFDLRKAWKTVNITRISEQPLREQLEPACNRVLLRHGGAAPLEYAFQLAIRQCGLTIRGVDVGDQRWYEVDTVQDLRRAEYVFRAGPPRLARSLEAG